VVKSREQGEKREQETGKREPEKREPVVKDVPKWAGGGLPPMPPEDASPAPASAPTPPPAPVAPPPPKPVDRSAMPADRQAMLDDPKLNDILESLPGATVTDIK